MSNPVYYLDIVIETYEKIPISMRVTIDQSTHDKLLKLTPKETRLIHVVAGNQYPGIIIPKPKLDPLDRLRIGP